MVTSRILRTRPDGLCVYGYESSPGWPPVSTEWLTDELIDALPHQDHTHDFFVLMYVTRPRSIARHESNQSQVEASDLYLLAPGEAVGIGTVEGLRDVEARAVIFPLDAVTAIAEPDDGPGHESFLSWRLHPLLSVFATDPGTGARRLRVPAEDRPRWTAHLDAIDHERRHRSAHYRDAAIAHLRLLLIDLARLAGASGQGGAGSEPVIDEVLSFIDRHYREPISLRDVARAVNLSPGHLTTMVGSRTSRTVQQWITERRMAEARNLLDRTDIAVQEVGRRVGYRDPSFFARTFRQNHGLSPLAWRRASRRSGSLSLSINNINRTEP